MIKDATTWKAGLSAPATFWASLLVSSAVVNCLPLQAAAYQSGTPPAKGIAPLHVHEVPDTVATSSVPQEAASIDAATKAPAVGEITSVAELTSDKKDTDTTKVEGTVATPPSSTLEAAPVEASTEAPTLDHVPSVADLSSPEGDIDSNDPMSQVTNVTQLRDVSPGDWAFEALRSLVERYGCIAGYPDGSYRGNRAMSRYEFAAGLNACLQQVERLVRTSGEGFASKQDLATLQRLIEQFGPELATLRGRVDALEARTRELEATQFSTPTKLNAEVVLALAGVASGETVNGNGVNKNTVLGDRVRLNFDTSFTGKDLLRTRLQAVNLNAFSSNATFTPEGDLRFAGGTFDPSNNNEVGIDALLYQFPIGEKTTVVIEANAGAIDDFTNTVKHSLDGDGGSGALTHFGTRNPIYYLLNGAGIGLKHEFSDNLEMSLGYLANDDANPGEGSGLFEGPYGAIAQLTIKPIDKLTVGLTYIHAYNNDFTANGSSGSNRANLPSALLDNPNLPAELQPFSGLSLPTSSNAYGIQASFQVSPKFLINGWVGYTATRTLAPLVGTNGTVLNRGDYSTWNFAVNSAFPDLGKKGNVAGIIFGME